MDSRNPPSGTTTPATGSPHNPLHSGSAASTQQDLLPPSRHCAHHLRHQAQYRAQYRGHLPFLLGRHPPVGPLHQPSQLDPQPLHRALPLLLPQYQGPLLQNHHPLQVLLLPALDLVRLEPWAPSLTPLAPLGLTPLASLEPEPSAPSGQRMSWASVLGQAEPGPTGLNRPAPSLCPSHLEVSRFQRLGLHPQAAVPAQGLVAQTHLPAGVVLGQARKGLLLSGVVLDQAGRVLLLVGRVLLLVGRVLLQQAQAPTQK